MWELLLNLIVSLACLLVGGWIIIGCTLELLRYNHGHLMLFYPYIGGLMLMGGTLVVYSFYL